MKVERHIHLKDELICEFTEELYTFVNKIAHCMMPLTPLKDEELEEAHKLIREVYIK